jgi:hypothetical protein
MRRGPYYSRAWQPRRRQVNNEAHSRLACERCNRVEVGSDEKKPRLSAPQLFQTPKMQTLFEGGDPLPTGC